MRKFHRSLVHAVVNSLELPDGLCRSSVPLALLFVLNTHLLPMIYLSNGGSTRSQTWFLYIDSISSPVVCYHSFCSELLSASHTVNRSGLRVVVVFTQTPYLSGSLLSLVDLRNVGAGSGSVWFTASFGVASSD